MSIGALVAVSALFWIVLTRFESGEINGVDFTVYFDRPCFQTLQGRPLFVETADHSRFSYMSSLQHHAYWGMFPLCTLYAIHPSPYWLLAASVLAVVAGAVYTMTIVRHLGGPGILAAATGLAFVLNDTTARTLNYGFHPEVFYAWTIPWLLSAALRGSHFQFVASSVATVLVKEDAVMPAIAACTALLLVGRVRRPLPAAWLALPVVLALGNLLVYFTAVIPALTTDGVPAYGYFWASYGPTPMRALLGMMSRPLDVLGGVVNSAFFRRVRVQHFFLPVLGWRWIVGTLPIVVVYSASDDPQLRAFGIYYGIPLVPFLVLGTTVTTWALARHFIRKSARAPLVAAALVLAGVLVVGSGDRGYTLRPWRAEVAGVTDALLRLADEDIVLVQSGLYPHAGYDERIRLLTPEMLQTPEAANAALLLAPQLKGYPFNAEGLRNLVTFPEIRQMPSGLRAVRRPGPHRTHHGVKATGSERE